MRHFLLPPHLEHSPKPYVARPEETMAFYVRGSEATFVLSQKKTFVRPRAVLSGLWTGRIDRMSVEKEFLMLQVVFRPGGIFKLTGIPSSELVDRYVDLADIFPVAIRTLLNRFDDDPAYPAVIKAVDDFLLSLLRSRQPQQFLFDNVFHLLQVNGNIRSITNLAGEACLSLRQFERKALSYIGVPSATYQRIARFADSFRLKVKSPHSPWFDIAVQAGYYDYQHLVRDYKAFASGTPNSILAADQLTLERMLNLGDGYS